MINSISKRRRAELLLLSVTVIWGSTFAISKIVLLYSTPLIYTAIRFFLAAIILLILFYKRLSVIPLSTYIKGSILGFLVFFGFVLQTVGLQYTTASKSAFITGLMVVLTPIVHASVQRILKMEPKPLRIGNIVGVVCSVTGLYMLTSPEGSSFTIGDTMNLGCAFFFACYIVYLDFASSEPDKLQLTYVQFWICGILGLISAWLFEDVKITFTGDLMAYLIYLIIFATIVAMWVQNQFQGDTTPTRAAVIFSIEPVLASVFAYFILGEILGTIGVIGASVILVGIIISEFSDEMPFFGKTLRRNVTFRSIDLKVSRESNRLQRKFYCEGCSVPFRALDSNFSPETFYYAVTDP
jgi:drug/metabolite transporter (DMT)-like permease